MIHPLADTTHCPSCGHPCDLDPDGDGETVCPCCGWEFVADWNGEVRDDGGLDPDGCFGIDDEGQLTAEPAAEVVCPGCGRRREAAEPGAAWCPNCRAGYDVVWSDRRAALVVEHPGRTSDWAPPDEEELADEYEGVPDEPVCPNGCCDDDYGGPAPVSPLGNGWVVCTGCGFDIHNPALYRETVEQLAETYGRARAAGRVVIGPGGRSRSLEKAFGRVRPGGVIRLKPGEYEAPWEAFPFPVTLAADGPRGSAVIVGAFRMVAGELRAAGVTFRGPVELVYTRADLSRCEFGGPLTVSGRRSNVWVRGCRVRGGLTVEDGAAARLIRSVVSGAPADGVSVTDGGWASLDRCRVTGNGRDGVAAERPCGAFLRRCVVEGNAGAGVWVGGRGVLTGCRVAGNGGADVWVGGGARAVLRRCDVGGLVRDRGARVRVRRPADGADPYFVVGG